MVSFSTRLMVLRRTGFTEFLTFSKKSQESLGKSSSQWLDIGDYWEDISVCRIRQVKSQLYITVECAFKHLCSLACKVPTVGAREVGVVDLVQLQFCAIVGEMKFLQ